MSKSNSSKDGAGTEVQVSDVLVLDEYTVIADYKKSAKGEASISVGQTVEVVEKKENGWWFISQDDTGEKGWVPATYLEAVSRR